MELSEFLEQWNNPDDRLPVYTSGSTGHPQKILVEKRRMLSSARIICDFLELKEGDTAFLCMPLDYIAGKMMVVRSIERKLNLHSVRPSNHPLAEVKIPIDFAAMVPSQVYCSLQVQSEREKLASIKNLIIGGGAISAELEAELRDFPNNIWSTYGMTETLSHIALRKINGPRAEMWYRPFDSVDVYSSPEGTLVIDAPEISETVLKTNDIVQFHHDGRRFRIIGRTDNVICSGGVKLHMEEIEEKLRPLIDIPFCISKRKDEKFGEIAVLLLEGVYKEIDFSSIDAYSVPKAVKVIHEIPMTETGKISRMEAQKLALPWSETIWVSIHDFYQDMLKLPFICMLADGTLPWETFQRYLIQDIFYLENFSEEMSLLSKIMGDDIFTSFSCSALESEKSLHDKLIDADLKNERPSSLTESYNRYCMEVLQGGNQALSVSAMLPCMWIYMEVGRHIQKIALMNGNPYRDWIKEYTSDEYESGVKYMIDLADRIADRSTEEIRTQMFQIFQKSLKFEYEIWKNTI